MNPYVPKAVEIIERHRETDDTVSYKIKWNPKHKPGQILEASYPLIGEAPFGFASFSEDYVELLIRSVGNVTNTLASLKKGDKIWVRGPYGNGFPMKEMEGNDVCLIAGGTGIVPVKAALEYIIKNRNRYGNVKVFFGFRSPKQLIFKRYFKNWEKDVELYVSVDRGDKTWKGHVGVVTTMLDNISFEPKSFAIICGPPVMIKFAAEKMLNKGLNESRIFVSLERLMHCGIGKCGHCMVRNVFICKDRTVLPYSIAKDVED